MNYAAAFVIGALTSFAILIASLRFYVGIQHTYLVWVAAFVVLESVLFLTQKLRGRSPPFRARIVALILEAAAFAIGAAMSFLFFISIYPPNMG